MSMEPKIKDKDFKKFKKLLEEQYQWPGFYNFKFIVPADKVSEVEKLFPSSHVEKKISKKGNYVSCTISIKLKSPDHVIAIYQQVAKIEGLISL